MNIFKFFLTFILISFIFSTNAQVFCGSNDPVNDSIEALTNQRIQLNRASRSYNEPKIIPVVINVLHLSQTYNTGDYVKTSKIVDAIDLLNQQFESGRYMDPGEQSDAEYDFIIADKDINGNPGFEGIRYFNLIDYGYGTLFINNTYTTVSQNRAQLDADFGYYAEQYLNIYVINWTGGAAGFTNYAQYPYGTGVFMDYEYMVEGFNLHDKGVLAHECAHWFGVRHTFNGYFDGLCASALAEEDCNTEGDFVCDTYANVENQSTCADLCDSGFDPENIMAYTLYVCSRAKFTDGQIERMHAWGEVHRSAQIEHGLFLYNDLNGCTDPTACNYDSTAITDDGSCLEEDIIGVCGGTCTEDIDGDLICDDIDTCLTGADTDEDGICDSEDPCIGIADEDLDGICDDVDPCVGTFDICNICNGPGAIYECGCNLLPEGDCDCNGNQLDALGICGGNCVSDSDGNGICDDIQSLDPCNGETSITYNSETYNITTIGNQCWFSENLKSSKYRNGEDIGSIGGDSDEWSISRGSPQIAYPNFDLTNVETYGLIYNWYAVSDSRGLCPSGWHIPTDEDWLVLERGLGLNEDDAIRKGNRGSYINIASKLRTGGSSLFNSQMAGLLEEMSGDYKQFDEAGYYWTSTEFTGKEPYGKNSAWFRTIELNISGVGRYNNAWSTSDSKEHGMSVRCLKN